jgi:hypothetical protein
MEPGCCHPGGSGGPRRAESRQAEGGQAEGARPAGITVVEVYQDYGGFGGRHAGGGQGWTLRSNGTVNHTVTLTPAESQDAGVTHIPEVSGAFNKGDFAELLRYLQASRLLDLKAPPTRDEIGGSLRISVVRGGKRKSILIPDSAPPSAASAAGWVTLTLVRGITAETDWKDPAGNPVSTGLHGNFIRTAEGLTEKESYRLDTPVFLVRNAAGKEVGTLQMSSESGYFRLVLPPGAYQLALKSPGGEDPSRLPPKGYAWRAVPSTVQVRAGSMTPVTIGLEKTPAAP